MSGLGGAGTNPEQLLGAGYATCFIGTMQIVAGTMKTALAADTSVNALVNIGPIKGGFGIAVRLDTNLPEMDKSQARVDAAHNVCPYSNATSNNIAVRLNLL